MGQVALLGPAFVSFWAKIKEEGLLRIHSPAPGQEERESMGGNSVPCSPLAV